MLRARPNPVLVVLLVGALLVAPGCQVIGLFFNLVQTMFSVLLFWAKAPDAAGPPDDAVTLTEGLALALDSGARDRVWVVAPGADLPPEAQEPPFPGAVLCVIPLRDDELPDEAAERLRERGVELTRVSRGRN